MKRLDKFSILIENEEMGREVKRIANKYGINPYKYDFEYEWGFVFEDGGFCKGHRPAIKMPNTITFSQFKEMFEGEIEMWRPKHESYWAAIVKIAGGDIDTLAKRFWPESDMHRKAIELGVLELWFNPVFKQTSKTVIVGGKEWTVSKDGVTCIDKGFDPNDIEKLNLNLIVHIFGETATLSEIKNLVDTWNEIKNKELNK
jgi:hypothetical protein